MKNIRLFGTHSLLVFTIIGLLILSVFVFSSFTTIASTNELPEINSSLPTIGVTAIISDYNGYGVSTPTSNDGFIQLTISGGTPPYNYIWSNGDVTQDIYNLDGGIYGVYIIDAAGEEFSTTFEVLEPSAQVISLPISWSIVSTYINPVNPNIADVLAPIISDLEFVKDGYGNAYWPQYSVNMIGNIVVGEGYMVKTSNVVDLQIVGQVVEPENVIISIPQSWSIIGYLRTNPASISEMFSSIVNNIDIVKDYNGMVYWPSMNLDIIGDMIPGEGYQIKMNIAQTFSYPENDENIILFYCPPTLTDYDGNVYSTVQIGDQCWMAENLRTTHYADGSSMIDGNSLGSNPIDYTTKYYFDYNNNPINNATYGKLYSWAAMLDGLICGSLNPGDGQGVCPNGWHVPDNNDWSILAGTIDSQYGVNDTEWISSGEIGLDVGGKLKDNSSNLWNSPNTGATNSSGFSALPGGYRLSTGTYLYQGNNGYFWSSEANCQFYGWYRSLSYNKATINKNFMSKEVAFSVRCIKD